MSKLETNTIDTVSGTSTLQVGSTNTSTITLGASGDTINIPSGATINNNGTQTGFGGVMTPMFLATKANTGFTANSWSKVAFATEVFDTDNNYDNSTNYRFTPTTAGKYYVFVRVAFNLDSAADRQIAAIYKNGTEVARKSERYASNVLQNDDTSTAVDYIVDMNGSSDYVEAYGFTTQNGSTKNTAGHGAFGAYKIIE